jgi:PIN domain nuclease of toxin-antitoxin system
LKLLLDTHIILWLAGAPEKLSEKTQALLQASDNSLFFSSASIWEIVIKLGLGRKDFKVDPSRLRKMLMQNGYAEISITAEHALKIESLPALHKDPFDRMLLAQARTEGMMLLTVDPLIAQYQDSVLPA